jgi:uncharacterized protein YjbI with pentapeptide repeats
MSFLFRLFAIAFCIMPSVALTASELSRQEVEQRLAQRKGDAPDLSNHDLSGADLSGLDLHGADFFSSRLTGARLAGANLASANFTRAELQKADFSGANLRGANLYAAPLDGANFTGADLTHTRVICGGRGVVFSKAKLVDADLGANPANQGMVPVRAELPEANFDGADLIRANFTHAVAGASFTGATVTGARFDYAVLDGSNLTLTR